MLISHDLLLSHRLAAVFDEFTVRRCFYGSPNGQTKTLGLENTFSILSSIFFNQPLSPHHEILHTGPAVTKLIKEVIDIKNDNLLPS